MRSPERAPVDDIVLSTQGSQPRNVQKWQGARTISCVSVLARLKTDRVADGPSPMVRCKLRSCDWAKAGEKSQREGEAADRRCKAGAAAPRRPHLPLREILSATAAVTFKIIKKGAQLFPNVTLIQFLILSLINGPSPRIGPAFGSRSVMTPHFPNSPPTICLMPIYYVPATCYA